MSAMPQVESRTAACSRCGRQTEWDETAGPKVLCVSCWDGRAVPKERVAEQKRAYYEANRERVAEQKRAYREANRVIKTHCRRAGCGATLDADGMRCGVGHAQLGRLPKASAV